LIKRCGKKTGDGGRISFIPFLGIIFYQKGVK